MVRTIASVRAFALALLVALSLTAGAAAVSSLQSDTTEIEDCTTISKSGVYVIEKNNTYRTSGSSSCIIVKADDVVIDGQGMLFDGKGVSNTSAVEVVRADNVTIRNIRITDWHRAIHYQNASGTVQNVNVTRNAYGITFTDSRAELTGSHLERNLVGVHVRGTDANTFANNTGRSNQVCGIREHPGSDGIGDNMTVGNASSQGDWTCSGVAS